MSAGTEARVEAVHRSATHAFSKSPAASIQRAAGLGVALAPPPGPQRPLEVV